MSLITDIQTIVKDIEPDCTYRLSSYFKAAVTSSQVKKYNYPLIILDNELPKNNEIMKNAKLQSEARIRIYFLSHDNDPHRTDLEREIICQEMEDIANRVFIRIFQLDEVKIVNNSNPKFTVQRVFNTFATGLIGVRGEMLANEQLLINWC